MRLILRIVYREPKITYKSLLEQASIPPEQKHSVYRILKEHGITNWRAKRRPALTPRLAKLRKAFGDNIANNQASDWADHIAWSDEISIHQKGHGKRSFTFGTAEQKWDKDHVDPFPKSLGPSVMVWAGFGRGFRTEIVIMKRDYEAKHQGYSSKSYIEVLEEQIPLFWEPGWRFMQDNAPIHTARIVTQWFDDHAIEVVPNWPPFSPDLNPIEHAWAKLRDIIHEVDPDIDNATGGEAAILERLITTIRVAWARIPESFFDALLDTYWRRIEAVREVDGWYTKY